MERRTLLPRRDFLALGAAATAAALLPGRAFADTPTGVKLHGLSAFGDLKYKPDFTHFDYVNVDAPQGGTFNFSPPNWGANQSPQTFNTLNSFVPKGDSPQRMEMCFDTLMARALDEPDAVYGLIAQSVTISDDRNSFTFSLRPQARFHDGSQLTAEDAAFTFKLLKDKGHPDYALSLTHLDDAAAVDVHTLQLKFSGKQSARTILNVVSFPILSKAFFTANPFDSSQLNPPLGSSAYKVGRWSAGAWIEYERVADYWGNDLPVNRGQNNFRRIRIEFYQDRTAGFEAFKKGEILYREEFTSRVWATAYDFPAFTAGKVIKHEFPAETTPSMQATAVNQRREQFKDPRVRQAIALCFDFEWTRRNFFYGSYERSQSCFEKSDFRAEGMPTPQELALLESLRDQLPPETFGEAVTQPPSDGSGRDRKQLSAALKLLAEAGWKRSGDFVLNDKGGRLAAEFLVDDETFVQVYSPWVANMKAIGIDASIRLVDSAQYQLRQSTFDFDLLSAAFNFSATPTRDDLEIFFHSRSAAVSGSRNLSGIANPAVDALIDAVGAAKDRESLTTAMRALDRALRARRDWIPSWYLANHRSAYWDMFGFPGQKPDFGFPVEALWWFDKGKAAKIGKA
ncbi:ABC transporter substrate-binding protein [Mesorhizobium sp. M2A.F.Ca.ET.037.01.1.1]|uniref:extracellular solute-binding protein n=1 Tax=unclassified Mesorhizobium TaxID=325217 RepID=UPI000F74C7EE|nr:MULTISPECIES: extracellular solute-binding protein [unclassified Mesorhizobium]RUY12104.1 ABC transporter substrate-binding protein [Mesorhizobium sp. M2A.F.Ca.ET.040.01.1.1]RVC66810.1 ABC transporter substrate-binding protein [Mesorhizobium sp. M00.F.Ca.ET.038.03.1.1]RVC75847.1 ABC transporter substrate-binding protein [Mesorhizobium sp. M2A.F.Ca.ET.046.02.1.1]AZO34648.1 ABC transporter substrate-binding protein [Mesorhizobium sp. M2A.F.Ca.ET.046.03.2.1]RUX22798.1 ABC transporter substrate